jgi:hypothetical protein
MCLTGQLVLDQYGVMVTSLKYLGVNRQRKRVFRKVVFVGDQMLEKFKSTTE